MKVSMVDINNIMVVFSVHIIICFDCQACTWVPVSFMSKKHDNVMVRDLEILDDNDGQFLYCRSFRLKFSPSITLFGVTYELWQRLSGHAFSKVFHCIR